MIEFFVRGRARTAGSKQSGVAHRRLPDGSYEPVRGPSGRLKTFVKDSTGAGGKNWRTDVRAAASEAMGDRPPLDVPVALDISVYAERPKSHYGTGRNERVLKDSAPQWPTSLTVGDASKLARSIEDSILKLVFVDDKQVVDLRVRKRYADDGYNVGASIRVMTMNEFLGVAIAEAVVAQDQAATPIAKPGRQGSLL